MKNNLGYFFNKTNSNISYEINLHNFNILKINFDNIIIIDIDNIYSNKLKNKILEENDNLIINYLLNNIYIIDYTINNSYKYITFINDNYIYCDSLIDYFDYIKIHDLDFCSYTDSSENNYHHQLYFFTKTSSNLNKMSYLKVAYLDNNKNLNIFYNINVYKELIKNNMLPIIKIDIIDKLKNDINILPTYIRNILHKYKLLDYFDVPYNFNINKYKEYNKKLAHFDEKSLVNHWNKYGKNENRRYS